MSNAFVAKEVFVQTPDEVGIWERVANPISSSNNNVKFFFGGSWNDSGNFSFVAEDNQKAISVLRDAGFSDITERDIVVIPVTGDVGSANEVARVFSDAKLKVEFFFTTIFDGKPAVVTSTVDNQKAVTLFN